jgi:hypothetical protein
MKYYFPFILIMLAFSGCNNDDNDDDSNALCSNPIEVTGTPYHGYIIMVKEEYDPSAIATQYIELYGDNIDVYTSSSSFFAAQMSDDILSIIQCDSRIESISYDGEVEAN